VTEDEILARRDDAAQLVDRLKSAIASAAGGDASIAAVLDTYRRVTGEFRALTADAAERLDRAEAVIAEAREFARRRRRRAVKLAAHRGGESLA
jgi:hypothetical protein